VPERAPNEATVGRDVITVQVSAPDCSLRANCPPDVMTLTRAIDLKIT
jgi:hypothetical protein